MLNKSRIMTAVAVATLSIAALPTLADTVTYDFDTVSGQSFGSGASQTSVTVGNATFTQANAASATYPFSFGPNSGIFSNIGGGAGTILTTAGYAAASPAGAPAALTISFSSTVYGISFDYGNGDFVYTPNGGDLLSATINGTQVATSTPTFNSNGDFYAEGSLSYASATGFTSITLTSTDAAGAEDLALGDLTTQTTPVPVPAAFWMLLSGIGGAFGFARRRTGIQEAAVVA
jgi:hypothetical protein